MNKKIKNIFQRIALGFCVCLVGCGIPHSEVDKPPTGKGYGSKSYWVESWEPSGRTTDLHYWDDQKKDHLIWRGINNEVEIDDAAVFIGRLNSETGFRGNHLFAFQPPGPVVDITDQVFAIGAKEKGTMSKTASISSLRKLDDGVKIGAAFTGWTDQGIKLTWSQIYDIMRDVKEKGVVRKDRVWGTSYIEKEFKPETQK
jgi:hypothetical protein